MTAQLALLGGDLQLNPALVMTAHLGGNDRLIANAARLYIPDGATVIDTTFGKGVFWRRTDTSRFRLAGLDLLPMPGAAARADFRALPLGPETADVVVLDPPYVPVTSSDVRTIHAAYRNDQTPSGSHHRDTRELYRAGMAEALRVLRPGGTCWIKCQDLINGKQQIWSVVELHDLGARLGLRPEDLFVLVVSSPPGAKTAERQYHARRNHSYLWIFRKLKRGRP